MLTTPFFARGDYSLQIIAQAGDVIDGRTIAGFSNDYTNVAINEDGEVAFFALADGPDGIGWSVLTQRRFIAGAGKVVDGTVPRFNNEDHQLDINNRGEVVYTAFLPQGGRGLFVNEELLLQPGDTVAGKTVTLIFRFPQINDSGTVVVDGRYADGPEEPVAIFTQDEILAHTGQVLDGLTVMEVYFPRIGNNGEVASYGVLAETGRQAIVTSQHVLLKIGDTFGGMNVDLISAIGNINDSGEIPITVALGEWPNRQHYVLAGNDVLFRAGDVIAGLNVVGLRGSGTVLNNRDDFALLGIVEGGGARYDALFAGGRLVLSEGDLLNGKMISAIYPNFDMNDRGDLAFRVEFDDGSRAVLVATIPEPASGVLAAIALSGAFLLRCADRRRHLSSRRACQRNKCGMASISTRKEREHDGSIPNEN